MSDSSFIPERQLVFSPALAQTIGLEEAILLQHLNELFQPSPERAAPRLRLAQRRARLVTRDTAFLVAGGLAPHLPQPRRQGHNPNRLGSTARRRPFGFCPERVANSRPGKRGTTAQRLHSCHRDHALRGDTRTERRPNPTRRR